MFLTSLNIFDITLIAMVLGISLGTLMPKKESTKVVEKVGRVYGDEYSAKFARESKPKPSHWNILPVKGGYRLIKLG